ncbi:MAG: IGHMBP2 family helicase [candidate division WOR-3 bacterium]
MVFENPEDYRKHFSRLIMLERSEEMRAMREEILRLSGEERQATGRCVLDMSLSDKGPWLGGRRLVYLFRADMPETEIGPSDMVMVSRGRPLTEGIAGVILKRTGNGFVVVLDSPISWSKVRVDLLSNDITYERMLFALKNMEGGLFPLEFILGKSEPLIQEEAIRIPDHLNPSQAKALMLAMGSRPIFLIHGPFGTGKTLTLVEIIAKALERGERVLACGDSNVATDNLLEGLVKKGLEPLRIGHPAKVSPHLVSHSLDAMVEAHPEFGKCRKLWEAIEELKAEQSRYPRPDPGSRRGYTYREIERLAKHHKSGRGIPRERMKEMAEWVLIEKKITELRQEATEREGRIINEIISSARVICSTCSGAGSEFLEGEDFDLLVLDEATQATEPSALVPLIKARRAVLAGDHRQLPPTVISREAELGGLGLSFFERMIELHPEASTLLDIQYRMHPDIMEFPAKAFYAGKLRSAKGLEKMRLSDLLAIPARNPVLGDKPVFFVDTGGTHRERRRKGSPSRENPGEAEIVKGLVKELLALGLDPSEVGVIAPYEDQVKLLRGLLPDGVEVKTVDGFQGREKEVIILSLVRSNPKGKIGFLKDRRRLNVAITRARRKLIVIGDAGTLARDKVYRDFVGWARRIS